MVPLLLYPLIEVVPTRRGERGEGEREKGGRGERKREGEERRGGGEKGGRGESKREGDGES